MMRLDGVINSTGSSNWILRRKWKYCLCCTKNFKRAIKQHIKYFDFRSKIQLALPVQGASRKLLWNIRNQLVAWLVVILNHSVEDILVEMERSFESAELGGNSSFINVGITRQQSGKTFVADDPLFPFPRPVSDVRQLFMATWQALFKRLLCKLFYRMD